jgi:hypothetical protein
MRRLIGLLILSLVPMIVWAAEWSPYVGGNLQYDTVCPLYDLQGYNRSGRLDPLTGVASVAEAGVTSRSYSIYGAYVRSSIPSTYDQSGTRWRFYRYALGFRWHMNGGRNSSVQPTIGLAVNYGRTRLETEDFWTALHDYSEWSKQDLGTTLEFGMLIHTNSPVDFSVMWRGDRYEAGFGGHTFFLPSQHYVVLTQSVQLGARYVVRQIHIGH